MLQFCWSDAFRGEGSSTDQLPWAAVVEGLLPLKGNSRALEEQLCRHGLGRGESVRSRSGQALDRHRQWREALRFEDPPRDVFPRSSTASWFDIKDRGMAMPIRLELRSPSPSNRPPPPLSFELLQPPSFPHSRHHEALRCHFVCLVKQFSSLQIPSCSDGRVLKRKKPDIPAVTSNGCGRERVVGGSDMGSV